MDTTVALRALCILLIVGTHANVFTLVGGAHLLLAVAGYNFARFQLADVPRAARVRNGLVAVAQVVVPSSLFIGAVALLTGEYDRTTARLPQRAARAATRGPSTGSSGSSRRWCGPLWAPSP